jgi:hypothetical protein
MKSLKSISILILVFLCSSCKWALMSISGFREPAVESKESVYEFLHSLNQDTSDVYVLDTNLFQELRQESFKPGMSKSFRPVQIRVYDRKGMPVMQWASCEGSLKELKTFDTVPPRNHNGLNTRLSLQQDLLRYFSIYGRPAYAVAEENCDYSILVYFAKYFPRLSRESFSQVDKYRKKHPELKVKVYKINVDVQQFWGVEPDVQTEVSVGGKK